MLAGICEVDLRCGRYVVDDMMNEFSRKICDDARADGFDCRNVAQVRWVGRQRGGEGEIEKGSFPFIHVVFWGTMKRTPD